MTASAGDHAPLRELEVTVETELTVAETSAPERLPDPDGDRYEVRLRALLGAVEALEDGSGSC